MSRIEALREAIQTRLDRRLPTTVAILLGLGICVAPVFLMWDELVHNPIGGDDYVYIARSRSFERLLSALWVPHNTHVAPLFRIWTYVLIQVAGSLERLPTVLAFGAYVPLVLAMLAGGHLIAHESGSTASGLAAMAWIGVNSVLEPVVAWYSSSQALWAGAGVLATLCFLQSWRARGGWWRLAIALAMTPASGWFWSEGYLAGPAGLAYLWCDGRKSTRKVAMLPLLAGLLAAAIAIGLSGGGPLSRVNFHERSAAAAFDPIKGLIYTCQAIPEGIVLANLGVDAEIEAGQGIILMCLLLTIWISSRIRSVGRPFPNALEASGAAMVLGGALLVYGFRSYLPFDSVRGIWVYLTIPQLGAIVFVAGWIFGLRIAKESANTLRPIRRIELLGMILLVISLMVVHQPRSTRLFLLSAPPVLEEEGIWAAKPMWKPRAIFLQDERAERQRRFLARLDRAERVARERGIDPDTIRRAFGRVIGSAPEWPVDLREFDATDLLILPNPSSEPPPIVAVRAALGDLLKIEPEEKPPWLKNSHVEWPPKR